MTRDWMAATPGGYPRTTKGLLVVWGLLAATPFGGMTWQVLHYLAGFRRLGYDVWYVEDADVLYSPGTLDYAYRVDANVQFLARQMELIGLADRWLFRTAHLDPTWYGNGDATTVSRLNADADAVFNLCGSRAAYSWVEDLPANLVYLETDPGDMQAHVDNGDNDALETLSRHHHLATYGRNVGTAKFPIPVGQMCWRPTAPPVILDWWDSPQAPRSPAFTTITQWHSALKPPFTWRGLHLEWRKDILFERVIELPTLTQVPLELAVRGADEATKQRLRGRGWAVAEAARLDPPDAYRDYIRGSAGEFTITKDQYTKLCTGWFSDRSVCYLAAGRPVVTQATGFEEYVPTGQGLFAFDDLDGAATALDAIAAGYDAHVRAAREIAREYFATDRVLPDLLDGCARKDAR